MVQILGIDHIAINVRDIDKSVDFYTKILGLKVTQREPSKSGVEYFLDCGTSLIGIIQAKDFHHTHPFAHEGLGANHFSFRVHASKFDAMIKWLEENNIKIEYAKKREKSWSLYFYDIDANKLEITAWPREDGLPDSACLKVIYDPKMKAWTAY